jgi:hypothetical protein
MGSRDNPGGERDRQDARDARVREMEGQRGRFPELGAPPRRLRTDDATKSTSPAGSSQSLASFASWRSIPSHRRAHLKGCGDYPLAALLIW